MNENLKEQIKELTGIEQGSDMEIVFNTLAESAPFIGRVISSFKINRLGKRLNRLEDKINEISEKVNMIGESGFKDLLINFLFPHVLQSLLEEDEENKIAYFLEGFEYVIDNTIYDKSKILMYYDAINELRAIEIEYLISLSSEYQRYKIEQFRKNGKFNNTFFDKGFREIEYAVENKLERLGLIDTGRLVSYKDVRDRLNNEIKLSQRWSRSVISNRDDKTELTYFGKNFLNFFNLLDKYKS